jgi:hypothetical protein
VSLARDDGERVRAALQRRNGEFGPGGCERHRVQDMCSVGVDDG